MELSICLLLVLAVTVVQVEQSIIKSMFKSCKLFARLLSYFPHVVACGTNLHVVGAAGVAWSASPRHHGNTRVTKGDGWNGISTLSHSDNPIELEIQAESKADHAHNTHTQSLWWIGCQVESQMKRLCQKGVNSKDNVSKGTIKKMRKTYLHTR